MRFATLNKLRTLCLSAMAAGSRRSRGVSMHILGGSASHGRKCAWRIRGAVRIMDAHCSFTVSALRDCDFWPRFLLIWDCPRASPGRTFHDGWTKSVCAAAAIVKGGWLLPWCQSGDPVMCLTNTLSSFSTMSASQ